MNCEQLTIRLVEDLPAAVTFGSWPADVAAHLENCANCQAEAARLMSAHRALNLLCEDEQSLDERHSRPVDIAQILQHAGVRSDRSRRRWQSLGMVAAAACLLIVAAMLLGLRVNWNESGVQIAWRDTQDTNHATETAAANAARQDQWQQAESLLAAQKQEIESLKTSMASVQDTLAAQQQTNQELATAVQQQFIALKMQIERSDFRMTVLKANVRDLGSVLARFTAAVGRPVATNSTPGE